MSLPALAEPLASPEASPLVCHNCAAPLDGPYCAQCGQRHHDGAPTLRHVLEEFADDYLHLDSKLPRTIAALMTRPGYLTSEYVAGRRVRYVGPFKLYVLFSVLFFFCQAVILPHRSPEPVPDAAHDQPIDLSKMEDRDRGPAGALFDRVLGPRINHRRPSEVTRELRRTLTTYLPDAMLVLLPLVALLLKLLHWRRYYAEHFVLALHLHALGYLVFAVLMLARQEAVDLALLLAFVVYGALALRRVYAAGWPRTVFDVAVIAGVYPFALMVLVIATLAGGMWLSA